MHNSLITCREINCLDNSLCKYQDPITHETCMNETITFNNWAYDEYVKDAYNTSLLAHYEKILDQQGFVQDTPIGKTDKLDKVTKARQSKLVQEKSQDEFARYLASDLGTRNTEPEFEDINVAVNSLHLHEQDDNTLEQYQDILTDPYKRHDHRHLIKLLQTDEAINKELDRLQKTTYEFKLLQATGQKIEVLRQIESAYNIGFLDVAFGDDGPVTMEDKMYSTIKMLFKSKRKKPATKQELTGMYIAMIKHIAGIDIIETTRTRQAPGKEKERSYKINYDTVRRHLELDQYKNPDSKDFLPTSYEFLKPHIQDLFVD